MYLYHCNFVLPNHKKNRATILVNIQSPININMQFQVVRIYSKFKSDTGT